MGDGEGVLEKPQKNSGSTTTRLLEGSGESIFQDLRFCLENMN